MRIIRLEKYDNESLFWEAVVVIGVFLDIILFALTTYFIVFNPNSMVVGVLVGVVLTTLAMVFIGLKKGVLPVERVRVKI